MILKKGTKVYWHNGQDEFVGELYSFWGVNPHTGVKRKYRHLIECDGFQCMNPQAIGDLDRKLNFDLFHSGQKQYAKDCNLVTHYTLVTSKAYKLVKKSECTAL